MPVGVPDATSNSLKSVKPVCEPGSPEYEPEAPPPPPPLNAPAAAVPVPMKLKLRESVDTKVLWFGSYSQILGCQAFKVHVRSGNRAPPKFFFGTGRTGMFCPQSPKIFLERGNAGKGPGVCLGGGPSRGAGGLLGRASPRTPLGCTPIPLRPTAPMWRVPTWQQAKVADARLALGLCMWGA